MSLSYLRPDKVHCIRIHDGVIIKVSILDSATARIWMEDAEGVQVALPAALAVTTTNGEPAPLVQDTIIIHWDTNYLVSYDGEVKLRFTNQRQQSVIRASNGVVFM